VVGAARISLPAIGEDNEVVIHSHSVFSHSGEGLHRFVEPVDAQVYLYSQFEPADARRVYPNMEQPDLKANFHVTILVPDTWTIATNAIESQRKLPGAVSAKIHLAPTKPIST